MKKLFIFALVVSCGKHTLLTMPEIDLNYDKGGDNKPSESTGVRVLQSTIVNCNMQAYRNRCTSVLNTTRQLLPHEFYTNFCSSEYGRCIGVR